MVGFRMTGRWLQCVPRPDRSPHSPPEPHLSLAMQSQRLGRILSTIELERQAS